MTRTIPLRRALISVSDKSGLIDFARALADRGVELLSTGGTSAALRQAGLPVRDVADVTGFPEMMDGRVKTLHPAVHGGLLALRDDAGHVASMKEHGIEPIDLLVVNLYPFEATVAKGAAYGDCVENIDIGGPAMIRAAAKNHAFVTTIVDVDDYAALLEEMDANDGATTEPFRKRMAQAAYARTAAYDAAVSTWMAGAIGADTPRRRAFAGTLARPLRYGENPHQQAAFYTDGSNRPGVATARQWQGKELSYNNINDTDAAFELAAEFPAATPAVAIIKHANPCGVAQADTLEAAYRRAFDCDRTSAFGGIVALNGTLDEATARAIAEIFTEVVIAPDATEAAREVFAARKNLRLLTTGGMPDPRAGGGAPPPPQARPRAGRRDGTRADDARLPHRRARRLGRRALAEGSEVRDPHPQAAQGQCRRRVGDGDPGALQDPPGGAGSLHALTGTSPGPRPMRVPARMEVSNSGN